MIGLWLLACGGDTAEPRLLVSPAEGVVATTPWIPVQFEILRAEVHEPASMVLDGVDVTDPLGLSRKKSSRWGGMADHVASLDLRGLAPGEHRLEMTVGERSDSATFTFAPEPCRVDAQVVDGAGDPLAARVIVFYEGHRVVLGNPETAIDFRERDAALDSFYVVPGRGGSVFLPCRSYTLVATQGVRRDVAIQAVSLVEGAPPTRLMFVLPVAVETPGEHSADLHVHTGRSQDAALPDRQRAESLGAAGIEVVVVTDHDDVGDLSAATDQALGSVAPVLIQGVERDLHLWDEEAGSYRSAAHVNGFPLDLGSPMPVEKAETVAAFFGSFRSLPEWATAPSPTGAPVLQLNHPRGIHFQEVADPQSGSWGLFSHLGYDRSTPPLEGKNDWMAGQDDATGSFALDFDVLEVLNRFSLDRYRQVRSDWFALLDHGIVFTATGNSDSHGLVIEAAGYPVNLVRAPLPVDDDSRASWLQAVLDGDVRVTTGPVVGLEVDGAVARVRVQAASWVPVHQVRLVVSGAEQIVTLDPLADPDGLFGAMDAVWEFALPAGVDAWVVAEAGWPVGWDRDRELLGLYADVAVDHVPIGFTNPVFVDGDGDGVWTPPAAVQ